MKILELFRQTAENHPGRAAIEAVGQTQTYGDLEDASNRLASFLLGAGAAPGDVVAILARDAFDVIGALLACAKAGSPFMPLDPSAPGSRLRALAAEAEPAFLLASGSLSDLAGEVWEGFGPAERRVALDASFPAAGPVESPLGPGDPCYVYFTSGSTGRPKGIAGQAKSVDHFVRWEIETLGLGEGTRVSQLTSPAFDAYLRDALTPLAAGGTVCVPEGPETLADPRRLADWLDESRVGVVHCVPTLFRSLMNAPLTGERFAALAWVLLAGEPLLPADVGRWHDVFGDRVRLVNLYGPSETTMVKLFHLVRPADRHLKSIPIGRPMKGAAALVVNSRGTPCAPGEIGEIYLRTPFRSLGYYRRPDLTREAFIPNPFRDDPEDLVYKTGDLGRALEDGTFEFLGRRDQQVKIGGVRVEMGEIEGVLGAHPAVAEAAVVDRRDAAGAAFLCAYYVAGSEVAPAALREYLAERLPAAMVPSAFRPLEGLPRQITGKLDRRALKSLREDFAELRREYVAPRDEVEEMVAGFFAQALGAERVGIHDDFFESGGHSLAATQLLARLREAVAVELPLRALFSSPTVAGVAAQVTELLRAGEVGGTEDPIAAGAAAEDDLPLSFAQTRLWILEQLAPGQALYNLPAALRLTGELDVAALAASFRALVERHDALRATFHDADGKPVARLLRRLEAPLFLVDLGTLAPAAVERQLRLWIRHEFARPFDLARGPLFRAGLVRLGEREHAVVFTFHHIVSDGWSLGVVVRELAALYEAYRSRRRPALSPLPIAYADYARWQRRNTGSFAGDLEYWRRRLAGATAAIDLPSDRPRGAGAAPWGTERPCRVPPATAGALRGLAGRRGATLYMALLATFETLLHRHAHQSDLCLGTPVAGRDRLETRGLVGFFVNTLVLRADLGGDPPFRELLERVREEVTAAHAHRNLPFEMLVEALEPERDLDQSPLFRVMFALDNTPWKVPGVEGLEWRRIRGHGSTARFELTLTLEDRDEELAGGLEYRTALFDPTTVARLWRHFETLLEAILADPDRRLSELELLRRPEREQLLRQWNDTAAGSGVPPTLDALVAEQTARTPDAAAVAFDSPDGEPRVLSYRGLERRAAALAASLQALGAGPETPVAVCSERGPELVVALVAVLRAGAAYVPLDPSYPCRRLAYMLEDAGAPVLLRQKRLGDAAPPFGGPTIFLDEPPGDAGTALSRRGAASDNPAYVIYTSGSTGRPKGAVNSHRAIVNRLLWMQAAYGLTPADRVLQKTPVSFDVSVWELFWPLVTGACLVLARPDGHRDSGYLARLIATERISTVHFVPSMLRVFLGEPESASSWASLRRVIASGEALSRELAERFREQAGSRAELHNLYGPTEAAVDVTSWACNGSPAAQPTVPIGRPIANLRVYLFDRKLRPVAAGVSGELFIGGVGLARGYWRRPALTAAAFLPDPVGPRPGQRLYRTGDLSRLLAGGAVEFLGRIDHQVKLRGQRIELGEIEAVLESLPGVVQSVVTLGPRGENGRRAEAALSAFVVREPGQGPPAAGLRELLRERLPEAMVPAFLAEIEALPLTPNGKVDRAALSRLERPRPEADVASAAPRTPVEELVAGIFAEVLQADEVRAGDHFFDRGGHSLLATQAVSRLRRATGLDLSVRTLFERPTVAALAREIERARRDGRTASAPLLEPVPRDRPSPLSFAQQRLFFHHQLEPESGAYNLPGAVRLLGPLRPVALAEALADVARRHEVLRTTFATLEHDPVQVVAPCATIPLPAVDLAGLPPERRGEEARRLAEDEALAPFDLARGPLLRCRLLRLAAADHVFLFTQHHVVSDGWSLGILIRELAAFYAARAESRPASLPELPVQYADFAAWQRRWLTEDTLEALLEPCRERLEGIDHGRLLPPDRSPGRPPGGRAESLELRLDRTATESLRKLARGHDATLFMTLFAAFAVVLHRASGKLDMVVATDVANRNRAEVEDVIGFFVNQVLLRLDLGNDPSFAEILARTRREALDAYDRQDLPFDRLVAILAPERDASRRTSLFQVKLVLQQPLPDPGSVAGLRLVEFGAGKEGVKFDLLVNLVETEDGLAGSFDYAGELFERETIETLRRGFETVLRRVVVEPSSTLAELADGLGEADRRHVEERDRDLEQVAQTAFRRTRRRAVQASIGD